MMPPPQTLGAAELADRAIWLLFSRPGQILKLSWGYWAGYWLSLFLLLTLLPKSPSWLDRYLVVGVWIYLCQPFWKATLSPLSGGLFGGPPVSRWHRLRVAFSRPWLVSTLSAVEGLSYQQAVKRTGELLQGIGYLCPFLWLVWLGLAGLLAELVRFALLSCLPWAIGALDLTVDTQLWFEPVVQALWCMLGGLVPLGMEISCGLLCQEVARHRQGGDFLEALEREYPP